MDPAPGRWGPFWTPITPEAGSLLQAVQQLRALGVTTIPAKIALKSATRPKTPSQTDLSATASSPMVCAAWLRFQSSDAGRAQGLAASCPCLVVTSSREATAKTLAGLVAGNALALTNSVRVEGALIDNGDARARLNTARLGVAQAEIDWLTSRGTAEITALDSAAARQSAEASLAAALLAHQAAPADLARVRARHAAGVADGLELAEAERAIASAQRDIDTARAETFRAAALHDALHDALPPPMPDCAPVMAVDALARVGAAKTL